MRFQHKAAIERSTVLTLKALSRKTYLCFEEQRDTKRNVYNFVQLTAKMYLHNFSLISHFLLVMNSTFRPAWLKKKKHRWLDKTFDFAEQTLVKQAEREGKWVFSLLSMTLECFFFLHWKRKSKFTLDIFLFYLIINSWPMSKRMKTKANVSNPSPFDCQLVQSNFSLADNSACIFSIVTSQKSKSRKKKTVQVICKWNCWLSVIGMCFATY